MKDSDFICDLGQMFRQFGEDLMPSPKSQLSNPATTWYGHSISTTIFHLLQRSQAQPLEAHNSYLQSARRRLSSLMSMSLAAERKSAVAFFHWLVSPVDTRVQKAHHISRTLLSYLTSAYLYYFAMLSQHQILETSICSMPRLIAWPGVKREVILLRIFD